ncbi:hypothetical protein BO78DRAFT_324689, partial [Aspergillus sclerotiicarbonarius CBS 121057]
PQTLDKILTAAYAKRPNLRQSLYVVTTLSPATLSALTYDSVTTPPITTRFVSPFLGWSPKAVKTFVVQGVPDYSLLDYRILFIADEQTVRDKSLLLVEGYNLDDWMTVRVAPEYANVEARRLSWGKRSTDMLVELADAETDGVYRGIGGEPAIEAVQETGLETGDY